MVNVHRMRILLKVCLVFQLFLPIFKYRFVYYLPAFNITPNQFETNKKEKLPIIFQITKTYGDMFFACQSKPCKFSKVYVEAGNNDWFPIETVPKIIPSSVVTAYLQLRQLKKFKEIKRKVLKNPEKFVPPALQPF